MKIKIKIFYSIFALTTLCGSRLNASPTTDDCVQAAGCFQTSSGGQAHFDVTAVFDVETHSSTGSLINFVDAAAGINVSSPLLTDYANPGLTSRNLRFTLNSTIADEARVLVEDNGALTADRFEIQLLRNGNIVYQQGGNLLASCGGGVVVSQNCQSTPPPPCILDVSASFTYGNCETVTVPPPKPPKCDSKKPTHCRKHCPNTRSCSKHKNGNNNNNDDDCQKTNNPGTTKEVCDVKITYTIKNTGPVPITSLTAVDAFGPLDLSGVPLPLAPGATLTLEANEQVTGEIQNKLVVTANQSGDSCSASADVLIKKPQPTPGPCVPPKGACSWEYWKSHPECWPVQTVTYCGKTYSIAEIVAALEKLSQYDWFRTACEKYVADYLNYCKRD